MIAVIWIVCEPLLTLPTLYLQMLPPGVDVTGIVTFGAEFKNTPHCVTPATTGSVTTNGCDNATDEKRNATSPSKARMYPPLFDSPAFTIKITQAFVSVVELRLVTLDKRIVRLSLAFLAQPEQFVLDAFLSLLLCG